MADNCNIDMSVERNATECVGSRETHCCNGGSCSACPQRDGCNYPRAALAGRGNLYSYDWLQGINGGDANRLVEVLFKNTRKSYHINSANLHLKTGDVVVVEGSPGQDLGKVTMVGPLVAHQMRRANLRADFEPKKIYRLATDADMERFRVARDREHDTMIRSRQIAADLGLKMKIGDVEYQGDGHKAIFYYIADDRVDFRKLIRILADTFGVRVEMKQIGARQEAGRIGGIGPCGRPLCCATFLSKFASVGTGSARLQDISMNPQKLAGQCAKLKCCLNFEVDTYVEAQRKLPPKDIVLQTKDKEYYFFKADILKREISYTPVKSQPSDMVTLSADRVFDIITLNKRGIKPDELMAEVEQKVMPPAEYVDLVGQDSLTRFDKNKRTRRRRGNNDANDAELQTNNAANRRRNKQTSDKKTSDTRAQQKQQSEQQKKQFVQKKQQTRGNGFKNKQRAGDAFKDSNTRRKDNKSPKDGGGNQQNRQQESIGSPVSQSSVRMARAKQEKSNG